MKFLVSKMFVRREKPNVNEFIFDRLRFPLKMTEGDELRFNWDGWISGWVAGEDITFKDGRECANYIATHPDECNGDVFPLIVRMRVLLDV